jgi:hypothetical protein
MYRVLVGERQITGMSFRYLLGIRTGNLVSVHEERHTPPRLSEPAGF